MKQRTNQQWVNELQQTGSQVQRQAYLDLGEYLFRAIYNYLLQRRSTVPHLAELQSSELEELAEGFVQDSLENIPQKLDTYRAEGSFKAWATTIAVRTAGYELRKPYWRRRTPLPRDDSGTNRPEGQLFTILQEEGKPLPSPEQQALRREIVALLNSTVQEEFSERQRAAFEAIFLEDRDTDEIAAAWQTSRGAIYSLIHEGRKKIRNRFTEEGYSINEIRTIFS